MTLYLLGLLLWAIFGGLALFHNAVDDRASAKVFAVLMWIAWAVMIVGIFIPVPLG